MFALFKKNKDYRDEAAVLYARLMEHIRQAGFYTACGVPDTFIGRFDLLILHVFMVIHRLHREGEQGQEISQALFDAAFANMDQGLRELGIGDMGVPKRMRKMMKAFNGRMHGYDAALVSDEAFMDALRRNLYGTVPDIGPARLRAMLGYVRSNIDNLANQSLTDLLDGRMVLREI